MMTNPQVKCEPDFRVPGRHGRPRQVQCSVLVTAVLIAVSALAASAAHAATGYGPYTAIGTGSNGLNERAAPSTSAALVGRLPSGATLYLGCQTSGTPYSTGGSPASDSIWDQLTNGAYVADYWVSTLAVGAFSPGIPQCGTQSQPPPPTAQSLSTGKLENRQSARCLDADAATIGTPGTRVQLWDCLATQPNQNWSFDSDGTIRSLQSGQCLDADMNTIGANGTAVHLWTCNGGTNQQWTIDADGAIRNRYSGRCLDADWGTVVNGTNTIFTNGTKIQLWDCNGGHNQQWTRFRPNAPVPYLCYTYTTGLEHVTPPSFSFGVHATFCYNGSRVVRGSGHWVTPWCSNPDPTGDCSVVSETGFGGAVNVYFHVSVPFIWLPWLGGTSAYYSPVSWISVTANGQVSKASDPGYPVYGH
jgi:hypothetical protein